MMTKENISIYIHIPFCISKCKYCAFYSEKYNSQEADAYTDALIKNIEHFSQFTSSTVETIYFGGGTPTVLGAKNLSRVLNSILSLFNVSRECEITFETNPKTIEKSDADLLFKSGFNRASLGIQTTKDDSLMLLGRIHSWNDAVEAYNILKSSNILNISVDIMYALPNSTIDDVVYDVEKILELEPNHISAYALSIEEGTPLFSLKNAYLYPEEDTQLEMYLKICKILKQNGYQHYEISNFAKKGFESKHNSGYWERRQYIGFGSGAHSLWNNNRFFVESNRKKFIADTNSYNFNSSLGFINSEELSDFNIAEEEIMLSLRTSKGITLSTLPLSLKQFTDNGFATYKNGIFALTDKGYFVSNTIIYNVCEEILHDK